MAPSRAWPRRLRFGLGRSGGESRVCLASKYSEVLNSVVVSREPQAEADSISSSLCRPPAAGRAGPVKAAEDLGPPRRARAACGPGIGSIGTQARRAGAEAGKGTRAARRAATGPQAVTVTVTLIKLLVAGAAFALRARRV